MKMRFSLFSRVEFEVSDPIALIECYCFQNDFYANYHALSSRRLEDVNKIGARIPPALLRECRDIIDNAEGVRIFKYDLDAFLDLGDGAMRSHVEEVSKVTIKRLVALGGMGLSRATKALHTVYPHIIPIVDSLLQAEYRRDIDPGWEGGNPSQILTAYYANLKTRSNRHQLDQLFHEVSERGLSLTKVGVFDILWWSFLKADSLRGKARTKRQNLVFTTVKRV